MAMTDGLHRLFDAHNSFLESAGNVFHTSVGKAFDHALVSGEGIQGTEFLVVTTRFDVVEGFGVESFG